MAEFQEVMKHWRRMCAHYTTDDAASCCNGCPMDGRDCGAIYEDGTAEPEIIEREVQRWAAEHPEPVYPTWREWLLANRIIGDADSDYAVGLLMRCKRIPADLAEKLGIEPKEGV